MRLARHVAVLASLILAAAVAVAQGPTYSAGAQQLLSDTRGDAQIRLDDVTGNARFVRLPAGSLRSSMITNRAATAETRARAFFGTYGDAFGVADTDAELRFVDTMRDASGAEHAIFRQRYEGLPVFGAELRAHYDARGDLFAVNGTHLSGLKLDTAPTLTADESAGRAIRAVIAQQAREHRARRRANDPGSRFNPDDFKDLSVASTTLMVFRSGLVQGVPGADYLVYEVEVVNDSITIREFVYVDAHSGKVIDQISGIHDTKFRRAYDALGLTAPGPNYPASPFWTEGDPFPTSDIEADNMIYASGETYDLFFNAFGRDGFDAAGATMDAIFNRGNGCPNASWNGVFISFCPGLTTDDITAHEWGHAYTQYTNNLIYQWQSGALNESYSDIWGETVDLINARGLDAPGGPRTDGGCSTFTGGTPDASYRWLMGEESSLGAIRDMWNPTCAGDPGKVTDAEYWCSTGDSGGVHINSGIPNHAFALLVDGGAYNGYTITGLGLNKTAHIHYAAQLMLTPSSNFIDHADALEAACASLVGTDVADLLTGAPSGEIVSAADCTEVADAVAAVELRTPPDQCGFVPLLDPAAPALCEGGPVTTVLLEGFEGGSLPAGWTASTHDVLSPGTFDNPGWSVESAVPVGAAGTYAAFGPDPIIGDCGADNEAGAIALESPLIVLPAGEVPHVAFDHWVATETGWDGGNLKVSVNGGPYAVVPGTAYSFNAYNAALNPFPPNDNPLAGEEAFTGTDGGSVGGSWGQSQVDLLWIASPGDTVQLTFDLGTDGCNGRVGWYVDEVHAYSCPAEAFPVCGDGEIGPGEQCDDGNTKNGDGCTSSCQVQNGWACSDPLPAGNGTNLVADWSFEGGVPNADWTEFSSFGPPLPICSPGTCGPPLANTGIWYVWIGGISAGVTSSVEQTITIPATATDLTLQSLRGICDDPGDTLHVSLDGTDIGTVVCDGTDGGYVEQTFSVIGYNDGGAHTLNIGGSVGGTNGTHTNFFVDDVVINDNVPTPPVPSQCHRVVKNLSCIAGGNAGLIEFEQGIASTWDVVDNEGNGVVWTNISNAFAGGGLPAGNFTGGAGEAASVSSDAFFLTEYDTELISNPFSLANATSASLDYLANFQLYSFTEFLDVDVSTDGGASWANLLSWNEPHGAFAAAPGEAVSVDLAGYLGEPDVQVRWRYYNPGAGDWDWYAQVDNVALDCALTAPRPLKQEALAMLVPLDDDDSDGIKGAIKDVERSLRPQRWINDHRVHKVRGRYVFSAELKAVNKLLDVLDDGGLSPMDAATIARVIEKLVLADDQLAQRAIDNAIAETAACDPNDSDAQEAQAKIDKALLQIEKARVHAQQGRPNKAIAFYRASWKNAQRASDSAAMCAPP